MISVPVFEFRSCFFTARASLFFLVILVSTQLKKHTKKTQTTNTSTGEINKQTHTAHGSAACRSRTVSGEFPSPQRTALVRFLAPGPKPRSCVPRSERGAAVPTRSGRPCKYTMSSEDGVGINRRRCVFMAAFAASCPFLESD